MGDTVKQLLIKPIQLADQVCKAAEETTSFKQECLELKSKTEKLATLLRQAARARSDIYERPARRIIQDTHHVLDKTLSLVLKCRANGLVKRVFTIIPTVSFRKSSSSLENSIGDVSWLLRISAPADDRADADTHFGLPPIASNLPILGLIWGQIAVLYTGSPEDRSDAAAIIVSTIRGNERYASLIIEEGGVGPLLKLIKEGKAEGQENGARAIGHLGRDPQSVEHMIDMGVCSVFAKVLKEGPMKVQCVVAWAVSELVTNHPNCQDPFAQQNIIRLLVSHLAYETVQEHSKYAVVSIKPTSIHAAYVMATSIKGNLSSSSLNKGSNEDEEEQPRNPISHPSGNAKARDQLHTVVASTVAVHNGAGKVQDTNHVNEVKEEFQRSESTKSSGSGKQDHPHHQDSYSHSGSSIKGRELEDPETKASMKEMAAKALWKLAKGNSQICHSITESRALLCFAVLLEGGTEAVQYNSAMALMEITAVAEKDAELRRSAFKPTSPACKAVVDQMIKIVEKADSDLLIPCMKSIGNLARTFKAKETRMIGPLVRLLEDSDIEVVKEATIALTKFACTENYLHVDHSKAIISEDGAKHLIQLVYFGEEVVKIPALVLLSYIALSVPDSEELAKVQVLGVLEWASKQASMIQDETLEALLHESRSKLELYQSRV
ncbi:hypothetical protein TanjilG_22043 [Lupinus angustifolius]|uniref:DUF7792 domain-containing protein n=1 Tax=Lupinus angustifolius TaxID=3871 RepID=A0A4P1QTP4_LUPAN|nr:PREDICTED: uncharacterized protein LOC109331059 [Lupinus angustifolius]OIV94846.1 hypothetical protein TanjilG_22043 [Lupinus angustifolius]